MRVSDDVTHIRSDPEPAKTSLDTDHGPLPEPEAEDDLPDLISAADAASALRSRRLPWTAAMARSEGRGTMEVRFLDPAGILESIQDAGGFFALVAEPLVATV